MPIEIQCQQCNARFRVGEQYVGKRVKCAKCRATILVEEAEPLAAEAVEVVPEVQKPATKQPAAKGPTAAKKPAAEAAGDWFMQTEEGEQYGPVSKADLDAWVAEGRLDAGCQVLRDGWEQWKWAEEVFPQLSATPAAPPATEQVIEVAPITATLPTPVVPQVAVAPAAAAPVTPTTAPMPEIGTRPRGGRSGARRGGHPDMNFAIQTLPICAFVVAGLAAIVALYAAYEFFNMLSFFNEASKLTGASMTGPITRLVLGFLVGEVGVLVSGFVSFVILRALPEWMTLSLKNDQQIQAISEKTQ